MCTAVFHVLLGKSEFMIDTHIMSFIKLTTNVNNNYLLTHLKDTP